MEVSGQLHTLLASALGEECLVSTEWEAGFVPEPFWTFWRREKSIALARNHGFLWNLWIMTSCYRAGV